MKTFLRAAVAAATMLFVAACGMALAPAAAVAQNTPCYMTDQGARWEIGAGCTLDVGAGGVFSFGGLSQPHVAAGTKALSGSNPTTVTTGLSTIAECVVTLATATAPGVSTTTVTYTASGGTLSLYAWKPTSSSNPTLIASTGTDTVAWSCFGT